MARHWQNAQKQVLKFVHYSDIAYSQNHRYSMGVANDKALKQVNKAFAFRVWSERHI